MTSDKRIISSVPKIPQKNLTKESNIPAEADNNT